MSTNIRVLRPSDYKEMPWKNGLGSTTEIALHPPGASLEANDFLWRLSSATVKQDGPFSLFPGCERFLAMIEGSGIELTCNGRILRTEGDQVVRFSGEAATTGRLLGGPARDLNLIVKTAAFQGRLELLRASVPDKPLLPGTSLVLVLEGGARVEIPRHKAAPLGAFEALLIEQSENAPEKMQLILTQDARVAVAHLAPA